MSTAYELANFLAAQGVGTFAGTTNWAINVAKEPVKPVKAITLYDTGGEGPDTDELDLYRPTFQVRTRCLDYLEGWAKQEAIRDILLRKEDIIAGDHRYVSIDMTTEILPIGQDDNNRFLLTANYRCNKERT